MCPLSRVVQFDVSTLENQVIIKTLIIIENQQLQNYIVFRKIETWEQQILSPRGTTITDVVWLQYIGKTWNWFSIKVGF